MLIIDSSGDNRDFTQFQLPTCEDCVNGFIVWA